MNYEAVYLTVLDDDAYSTPVAGVVVRVFNNTGTVFQTQAITDEAGIVSFTLLAPLTYSVRLYKEKFSIKQPQLLPVVENPEFLPISNNFIARGHAYKPPESVHPRLCRCSGFFKNLDNSPAREHSIHVISVFDPLLFEGDAMLTERLQARTDDRGYAEFDLVRNGQYLVTVEGFEDQQRTINVPDSPSANLPDMFFEVVESVAFDPPGPWGVTSGDRLLITPTVRTSTGRILPGLALDDLRWSTGDSHIALVCLAGTQLELRGDLRGVTELRACRSDNSIVRIPSTPLLGVPQAIQVT